MNWTPIFILAAIQIMGLGIQFERHGQKKEGNYNANHSIIALCILWGLLWWSGIFDLQ